MTDLTSRSMISSVASSCALAPSSLATDIVEGLTLPRPGERSHSQNQREKQKQQADFMWELSVSLSFSTHDISDQPLPKRQIFKNRFCGETFPGSDLASLFTTVYFPQQRQVGRPQTGWHKAVEGSEKVLLVWILTASVTKLPPTGLA